MRLQSNLLPSVVLGFLPSLVSATGFDCAHINADGFKYDLSPLGGVHSVYHAETTEQFVQNTTGRLQCGTSKNICGFRYTTSLDHTDDHDTAFPIAGLDHLGHGTKDPEVTRLRKLDSAQDGLLVKLSGGEYVDEEKKKKDASAVIEFKCDPDRSGLEGLETAEDLEMRLRARAESNTGMDMQQNNGTGGDGETVDPANTSLQFKSFGPGDDNSYVLKLDWRTKYACDDYLKDNPGEASSNHWGFFTWLIIIVFLCTAAYLIFGSWLNYNRYGARGWDLLPHGDTIQDIPYILSDWFRKVVNTVQGTGSRGGYSAV
ncbi:hypothetical protein MW887_009638 [Aspergillus wentii]|nr:hypothetical protein MW887_009638 [Aspergillus wentii]